jgi:exopolysaccharide biosynthesis polyprenyl glycosylphosphotransferase
LKDYLLTYTRKRQYGLIFGDALVVFLSILVSYAFRVDFDKMPLSFATVVGRITPWISVVILAQFMAMYLSDLYDLDRITSLPRILVKVVVSVLLGGLAASSMLFFVPKYVFGREVLIIHLAVATLFLVAWRTIAFNLLRKKSGTERLAIMGPLEVVSAFISDISSLPNSGLKACSTCITDTNTCSADPMLTSVINHHTVCDLLNNGNFDAIAFDTTNGYYSNDEIRDILKLKFQGKAVYDLSALYENITGKVPLMYINGQWLLKSPELRGKISSVYVRVKRILDILIVTSFLIITSPLLLLIAILIKLESEGPVFFIQERLGAHYRPFKCYKFRTMINDAEKLSGPVWAAKDDDRITRVGQFLRKTRMDELPQLLNVLRGDMSFVGPRPIREHFAQKLAQDIPFYGLRFCVKPGLTGWAQVSYDYAGSKEGQLEKFQYELFYIRNMSLFLDLLVVFKTVKTMLKRTGQ